LAPGLGRAAEGDLDPTFGTQGKVVTVAGTDVRAFTPALAAQSDGRIVAASRLFTTPTGERGLILARYEADGTLDATFGSGGIVIETLDKLTFVTDAIVQPDGRIALVGASQEDGGDSDWMLRRYDSDGGVDATFGDGGVVETSLSLNDDGASRMAIQPDGGIVVVGGCR
jgi:uncharacterized delta-60 repeat protein